MAELTIQNATFEGIAPTFVGADVAGDSFKNFGTVVLHVDNQDTVAKQVTIASNPCNFGEIHDVVVSVPASEERIIGTFSKERFNDDNNLVNVTYDDVTSLSVAVIKY